MTRKTAVFKSTPFYSRMRILAVFVLICFTIITIRLAYLQVFASSYFKNVAADQYSDYQKIIPTRGQILIKDKFTEEPFPVASSVEQRALFVNPSALESSQDEELANKLSGILSLDKEEIKTKLADKNRKHVLIKRQLSEQEETAIKELKINSFSLEPETVRFYPEKEFLSQLLGYVGYKGEDRSGYYGLEQAFNDKLAGIPGELKQEGDISGAWIFSGRRDFKPAKNGDSLLLTIDKSIQFKAESVLKETIEKHGADSGSIIVMDPKTGAIMAMANYPNFDPNNYSKVKSLEIFNNLSTVGSYEPGSVFKPLTMAAALNEGLVSPDTTYTDTGAVTIDEYTIKNSDNKAHGVQTMTQVLEESLNTGMIFVKNKLGNSKFLDYIKKFGFGKETGIEVKEAKGDLSNLSSPIAVNYATASFGQGISVTPIQLLKAYSAIANNGVMMKPYVIASIISENGKKQDTKPEEVGRVLNSDTVSKITGMLVNVVENGHGKRAGVKGYYVAGKTGTAQVPRKDGRGYEANNNIGSFVGFAPANDPKFLMLVRVNHPRTVAFAESSAAPAFGQMAQFLFNYLNIPATRDINK